MKRELSLIAAVVGVLILSELLGGPKPSFCDIVILSCVLDIQGRKG